MDITRLLDGGRAVLAPMAGYTDRAFRLLCAKHGAALTCTEMISARAMTYGDRRTALLCDTEEGDPPTAVQLFGHDPEVVAGAVVMLAPRAAAIDLNMGCPAPKIVSNGDGCALMRDLPLAGRIIEAAVKASPVPVTVKLRLGWDEGHKNAAELARLAESLGAAAIYVHGRTRERMYRPPVDLDGIAEVRQAVSIPVVANGDIFSPGAALDTVRATGCRSVMIGRGALGDPFIFARIRAALENAEFREPTAQERFDAAREHMTLMARLKDERIAMLQARKHIVHYFGGIRGAAALRIRANAMHTLGDALELLDAAQEIAQDTQGGGEDGRA